MRSRILITGAASGLGQAFAQAYAAREDVDIICVDVAGGQEAALNTSRVKHIRADITSDESLAALCKQLENTPVHLVVHCAGVRGLVPDLEDTHHGDVAACETMQAMDAKTMEHAFRINSVGTFLLLRSLLPNLQLAESPKVVVMSSRMGSIGNNESGRKAAGSSYAYRASKAALNMLVRSLAVDVPSVAFVLCHPGRVETNLVRWKEDGAITAEESIQDMLPVIDGWTLQNSGKFYDRFGASVEW